MFTEVVGVDITSVIIAPVIMRHRCETSAFSLHHAGTTFYDTKVGFCYMNAPTKPAEINKTKYLFEQTSFENCLNKDFGPWCQSLAVFGVFFV